MSRDTPRALSDPARLATLRRTALLDSPAEESFDRLARLAAAALDAPVALISLVDEDRQFFKSCVGLPQPWADRRETPLSHSFCQYAVELGEPLIVEDARTDPRVQDNLAIPDLDVVAYAGIPLLTGGQALGTFCVIDHVPRRWTPAEVALLRDLAASVVTEIELRLTVEDLHEQREERAALLESTGEGIYGIDDRGHCTFANQAAAEMLGYTVEELLGQQMHRLIHHTRADGTPYPEEECRIAEAYRLGTAVRLDDEVLWRKDGSSFYADSAAAPLRRHGRIAGAVVTFADVSHRRTAERERRAALEQIRASERQYRMLFESVPNMVWMNGVDGTVELFNHRWYAYTGQTPGRTPGEVWMSAVHPDDQDLVRRSREAGIAGRRPYEVEFRLARHDGAYRWHRGRVIPLRDEEERVTGWIGSAADVDDIKRAEATQRFLAATGDILSESLDVQTTLRSVARLAVPDLADYCVADLVAGEEGGGQAAFAHRDPAGEALLEELVARYPVRDNEAHPVWEALRTGETQVAREVPAQLLERIARDARHLELLRALDGRAAVVVPLKARGQTLGTVRLLRTGAGAAYDAMDLQLAEELARRAALALDNARLFAQAQQAVRSRDDVLGVVSHDLRNPVGTVFMSSAFLLDLLPEGEERRMERDQLRIIRRAAERMNRLIQDLLDVTRVEAGRLSLLPEPLEVGPLLAEVREIFAPLAAQQGIELECGPAAGLPRVSADRERLLQVFSNLVGNALKFTPAGGRIAVSAGPGEGEVRFAVADTGSGIPDGQLPYLFERFWQARRGDRSGVGLGLPITRGIVEAHGGRIAVSSAPGQGTTFSFGIPAA